MRYFCCTMAVCLLCGCQGNSTALRNPFMSPDRVPPPATRNILPGTAQPYYPGDPVPSVAPAPGTVPPGGWGTAPQSSVTPTPNVPTPNVIPASAEISLGPIASNNEPAVQVSADQQNLRFAQPQLQPQPQQNVIPTQQPPAQYAVQPAQYQAPVAQAPFVGQPPFVGQAQYVEEAQRAVRIRAVSSPAGDSSSGQSRDGFRPQGSRLINRNNSETGSPGAGSSTRPGVAPLEFGPVREDAQRFGFDPQYQWLRGQLQYLQATGTWYLRYIPVQGGADQFGGQIPIANPHLLGELRPGDYVQVQGRLQTQQNAPGSSQPVYAVSIVQRQRVQ